MPYFLSLVIFFSSLLIPVESYAAKRVCVNSEGKLVLRKKCRASKGLSEATLTLFSESVQGPAGPQGPQGAKGDTGAQGPKGEQGGPGLSGTVLVSEELQFTEFSPVPPNNVTPNVAADCPDGKMVIGGGCSNQNPIFIASRSRPNFDSSTGTWSWFCRFTNTSSSTVATNLFSYAICADVEN